MDSYVLDMVMLFAFAFIPPVLLKKFVQKYVVWRFLLGPSALAGLIVGYYLLFKVELFG